MGSEPKSGGLAVSIEGISKVFPTADGPVHALDTIDLEIPAQQFCSVVGPSGCGKSTLLLMIAGLVPSSAGRVVIEGKTVDGAYTDLGIVFQSDVLLEWRSTLNNVLLQCEIRGLKVDAYRDRALELLEMVGLHGFESKYPSQLSGGMRQRTSICRALVHDPPLLLMDEPFGALDALTREQLNHDLLRMWEQERKTVFFITHSISEAVLLSDRVVVMSPRPGQIQEILDIELPRPRNPELRHSEQFNEYVQRIEQIFRSVGVLS